MATQSRTPSTISQRMAQKTKPTSPLEGVQKKRSESADSYNLGKINDLLLEIRSEQTNSRESMEAIVQQIGSKMEGIMAENLKMKKTIDS